MIQKSLNFPALQALALTATLLGFAQSAYADQITTKGGDTYSFSTLSSEPVVSHDLYIGEIEDPDHLTINVFGDGRVEVHYPIYMTRAGDYSLQLPEAELIDLLTGLVEDGVLDLNRAELQQSVEEDTLQMRRSGILEFTTDRSTSVIEMRLQSDTSSVENRVVWSGLESDAQMHPNNAKLQSLATAEKTLRALARDPRLSEEEGDE